MRSHHAPTKHLLERFTFKDKKARVGRSIWVYEKGKRPRTSCDLASECAQHGYFAGSSNGDDELQFDSRLNSSYEIPFNQLLPALDCDIQIFESLEVRRICALYVSNIFHRSKARRQGTELLFSQMAQNYRAMANSPQLVRGYAAKISILAKRPISIEQVRLAVLNTAAGLLSSRGRQAQYVDDLDRATKSLAARLEACVWSVIRSASAERFVISDTPVISMSKDLITGTKYGSGITKPNTAWYMPISHNRCLRIGYRPKEIVVSQPEIADLNMGQIFTMTSRLYSQSFSSWNDDAVQRYGGVYRYHVDVFKGDHSKIGEDAFDDFLLNMNL